MKTLLIAFISGILLTGVKDSNANSNGTSPAGTGSIVTKKENPKLKVPGDDGTAARNQFYQDFGNVPVQQWKKTKNFDEISFVKNGQTSTAFYDDNLRLVGTTTSKSFEDLPANAQKTISKEYKDYTVDDVILFDDNELNETDMILYDLEFEDADNYFVELSKDDRKIVVQADMSGNVSYFTRVQ